MRSEVKMSAGCGLGGGLSGETVGSGSDGGRGGRRLSLFAS